MSSMLYRMLQALLVVLVGANLLVATAWVAKDRLIAEGLLTAPPPARVSFEARSLPPIAAPVVVARKPPPPPAPVVESVVEPVASSADERPACVVLGAFKDRDAAVAARDRLEADGGSARVIEESTAEPVYLVYVEPADSLDDARRALAKLADQDIDAYVIRGGTRANGISVGLFTVRKLADTQRRRIAALGYSVRVLIQSRNRVVYRLRARDPSPDVLAGTTFVPCDDEDRTVAR